MRTNHKIYSTYYILRNPGGNKLNTYEKLYDGVSVPWEARYPTCEYIRQNHWCPLKAVLAVHMKRLMIELGPQVSRDFELGMIWHILLYRNTKREDSSSSPQWNEISLVRTCEGPAGYLIVIPAGTKRVAGRFLMVHLVPTILCMQISPSAEVVRQLLYIRHSYTTTYND